MRSIKNKTYFIEAAGHAAYWNHAYRQRGANRGIDGRHVERGEAKPPVPRGFSLIEVMVVMVVLAILAAIAYPSYQESVRKSRRAEGRAALMAAMQQQERQYSQNGSYVEFSVSVPNGFKWYSADSPTSSAYEISATPCENDSLRNCVLLSAKPGTERVGQLHHGDLCGDLTLASDGAKGATGRASNCW